MQNRGVATSKHDTDGDTLRSRNKRWPSSMKWCTESYDQTRSQLNLQKYSSA